jgi:hypothetical protein
MGALSEADLLAVWETAHALAPVARPLAILAVASGEPLAALAALPLGERDRRLLDVRGELCGTRVSGIASCERCARELEIAFDAGTLFAVPVRAPSEVRQPTTFDLVAAAHAADGAAGRAALLERWLGPEPAPEEVVRLEAALVAADPRIDTELTVRCPDCGHASAVDFDVGAFVWSEIRSAVQRLFTTVSALARAYGWSEGEVLALSPRRREAYLALAFA